MSKTACVVMHQRCHNSACLTESIIAQNPQGGSRLVLEAALCLALQSDALDADPQLQRGGLLTPASGLGATLIDRLRAADFFFDIKKEA